MRDHTPTVYLLTGSAGSDAKAYAQVLEDQGVVRLGPGATRDELGARLAEHVDAGRDAVLDEGLGTPEDLDFYKRVVEAHGAEWCVIHFSGDHAAVVRRLRGVLPARPTG